MNYHPAQTWGSLDKSTKENHRRNGQTSLHIRHLSALISVRGCVRNKELGLKCLQVCNLGLISRQLKRRGIGRTLLGQRRS